MVTNLTQLGYVNNYDKNRYLEIFSKAAVYIYISHYPEVFIYISPRAGPGVELARRPPLAKSVRI